MDQPLKKKRFYGPDVHLIHQNGKDLVEKTYRTRTLPVRLAGRFLVAWETYIYSKLRDIKGIPEVSGSSDPYTLTTVFMGGKNMRKKAPVPDEVYFLQLEKIITEMHDRGVIHLDMRNRRNYGIDEEGLPYLVDFASSLYFPFRGRLKKWLCAVDWMGYLKVSRRSVRPVFPKRKRTALLWGIHSVSCGCLPG